jgi:hypothetical protein
MENKNIIIILLIIIIVILAVMLGSMFMPSLNAQKDSKIVISGNKTLHDGDNLTVKLTDLNKTPIKKESVNITITDKKGKVVVNESVKTNSKGKANVNLDLDPGKYVVNVTFGGNDNFTGNTTSKKITIEEEVRQEPVVSEQSTASDTSSDTSSSEDELRPEVDSTGITREQADKYGWRYTTEHGGHYRGYHDHWDENAGIYHD